MWSMQARRNDRCRLKKRIDEWLATRRQFERSCQEYGQALTAAGIYIQLTHPL